MGIRKRKQVKAPARPGQKPQPINSAYAAEVQRRAEVLTEAVEKKDKTGTSVRSRQRQQAEQQMARLRSEAVQARRLAEHIENLSQGPAAYKPRRKHAMTDSTIVDPGHAQRQQRRVQDKPATTSNQLNFNPLHPSMELPPEQLIRLLGMESKKIRKSRQAHHTPRQTLEAELTVAEAQGNDDAPAPDRPAAQTLRPVDRSIQYERCEAPQGLDNGRSGLLVPALVAGVVAGIVVSGYLFWFQPADPGAQKAPAPVVASQPQKPQPKRKLVERTPAPVAKEQPISAQESAAWQARIKTREQQLRSAAEQRLAERISQRQQTPQAAKTDTAPPEEVSPQPVTTSEVGISTPEPVTGTVTSTDAPAGATPIQAPVQTAAETVPETPALAPVPPAVVEVPEGTESPIEATHPDTDVVPAPSLEPTAAMPASVEAIPEPDITTSNEIPDSEPTPAVSAVTEPETAIEPAPEPVAEVPAPTETTPAPAGAPAGEPSAATADDALF